MLNMRTPDDATVDRLLQRRQLTTQAPLRKGYTFSSAGNEHECKGELPRSHIVAHVKDVRELALYMYLTVSSINNMQKYDTFV